MRVRLTESEIRGIVRRRIVSQLLAEGSYDDALPDVDPDVEPFALGGAAFATGEEGDDEESLDNPKREKQKKGEETVEAIARIVGMSQAEWGATGPTVGPETGAAIKKYIDSLTFMEKPFVPSSADNVLEEWKTAADAGQVKDFNLEDGTKLVMSPDEKGLLNYVFSLGSGEALSRVMIADIKSTDGYVKKTAKPQVDNFIEAFSYSTSMEDLATVASDLSTFVSNDRSKDMMGTKLLLASFAFYNSTFRQNPVLKGVGYLAAAVAAAALIYGTGGFAVLGGAGVEFIVGSGFVASLTAAGSVIAAGSANVVGLVGAAAITAWGVTEALDDLMEEFEEAMTIKSYLRNPDEMDELALEIERTIFLSSGERERRAELVEIIREIYDLGSGATRQSVVQKLNSWIKG